MMDYGSALPEGFHIPPSAFLLRGDLERNPFKPVVIRPGDVVMDCGAYIGTFAVAALRQGAGSAVAYEAEPKNAALLRANTAGLPVTVIEAALTAGDAGSVVLNLSGFTCAHSVVPFPTQRGRRVVKAVSFRDELRRVRPHVLKIDVEGAEYDLLDSLRQGDLAGVSCVVVEFHPTPDRGARMARVADFITGEDLIIVSTRKRAFVALREARQWAFTFGKGAAP